jgi:hypothetical protein
MHVTHRVDVGGPGLLDRLRPHVEADVVRFHRVVGDALRILDEDMPLLDEILVLRRIDAHEVVPGGEMADQRLGVDAGELFFFDRKGHHGDVPGIDAWFANSL